MPLDPQAQTFCDIVNALPAVPPSMERLQEVRDGWGLLVGTAAGPAPEVFSVDEREADGVPVRIYRPSDARDLPVVVFFHGGGWTIGNVEQYDSVSRQVANASGAVVVAVDYRLAPEHPFPAPLDDCWQALSWTAAHAPTFGGDATRLAVMGDSAGGNLAAVCALLARDAGGPRLAAQVLVYPVVDCDFSTASYSENATGYLLTADEMTWFFSCYTGGKIDPTDWRISPLRAADLHGLPPAVVVTAGFDPLRDEGRAFGARLELAGVPVVDLRYDGLIHGFFGLSGAFDASPDVMQRVGDELSRAFGTLSD